MGRINKGLMNLNDQKYAMNKIIQKVIDRKAGSMLYAYHMASHQIDDSLKTFLDKLASIDGGPSAEELMMKYGYKEGYID